MIDIGRVSGQDEIGLPVRIPQHPGWRLQRERTGERPLSHSQLTTA